MSRPQKSFIQAVKSKIIIALLLACFAMFLAWGVSRIVFSEILSTVQNISTPSERLRLVNSISRRIARLDQQQKSVAFNDPGNYSSFLKESEQLRHALDSLSSLYVNNTGQQVKIRSIKSLLRKRDEQFVQYLKVREKLVDNQSISSKVKKLNNLVTKTAEQPDSTIITSEQTTSTTTIYPKEEKPKGFFNRLFGKRKVDEEEALKVVNQENVRRDTISVSKEANMAKSMGESLKEIAQEQKINSARFIDREAVLANANDQLINQMLNILREVETQVVSQIASNGKQAQGVINTGIRSIGIIMLVFFVLTILLLYFILTDITRSNKYRKELELAKEDAEYHSMAKQRFLSNMSHEIRTPLQSIIGYAELLKQQPDPGRTAIDAIYQSSEHLLQIVNEVLDYNRITSGKFTFSVQTFDIGKLLEEVVAAMRPQAEKKSLSLKTDIALDHIRHIKGDPFRLKQILYNLLSNAIKFTHVGEVVLCAFFKRQGESLHFTFVVKDTGIGISEEDCKKIFNEFEQVEAAERDLLNQSGAGLGLNIVKALVDNQGGRVYVKSKLGLGSSFTVYITYLMGEEDSLTEASVGPEEVLIFEDKVWVVDDDHLILDLCGLIFKKNKIAYTSFKSPNALLNQEWDEDVKYVFMDIRMPGMSGIELCKRLRSKVGDAVKIYAMTAQVMEEDPSALLKGGFDAIVQKPFKESDIIALLKGEREHIDLDLTGLRKMTFGDEEQLAKILNRFVADCTADSKDIRSSMEARDWDSVSLLVHRMAGRLGQIGAKPLGSSFRELEIEINNNDFRTEDEQRSIANKIDDLLGKVDLLADQLEVRA